MCFIVAFIRTLRFFVNMAYQNARNSNNQLAACALCCLECLIGLLESIVNYVNQYASVTHIHTTPPTRGCRDANEAELCTHAHMQLQFRRSAHHRL